MTDYSWRGKIGIITPAGGAATEHEFHRVVPDGVAVLTTRMPFRGPTVEELLRLSGYAEDAAVLLAQSRPDLIVFSCTAGSFVKGLGHDKEIIKLIENRVHIPAITTSTAVIEALNALKVKKIAVGMPYPDDVVERGKAFLEDSGFTVTCIKGLGLLSKIGSIPDTRICKLAREVFSEEAEALFISCTGLGIITLVQQLEEEFKLPVITSNQATIWVALKRLRITNKIEGYGRLFDVPLGGIKTS